MTEAGGAHGGREALAAVVGRFGSRSVLVVGDAMLDVYLRGTPTRLCREGPVPVVEVHERAEMPGGAANVCANAAALGASVTALLVTGDDAAAAVITNRLAGCGVATGHVIAEPGRDTPVKHRLLADGGLVARFDDGRPRPLRGAAEQRVAECLTELAPAHDAVVISDYRYGVMSAAVIGCLPGLQRRAPTLIVADARDLAPYRGVGVAVVTPSYEEAARLLGLPALAAARVDQIEQRGGRIPSVLGCHAAAVTLDADGALLFEAGRPPYRTYARAMAGPSAAGRGDTYASALTMALAAGADLASAGEIAGLAAGLVAASPAERHVCTNEELVSALTGQQRLTDLASLLEAIRLHRQRGHRIVFTNGCFDILHSGHVWLLNRAKARGDVLVVAVNSDGSVSRLKGGGRPINPLGDRLAVLGALSSVDYLISFEEDSPAALIDAVRPDVFVKGGDYRAETVREGPLLRSLGARVEILPYLPDHSTTRLIDRISRRQPAGRRPGP